jgi:hypothetical protein
VGTCKRTKRTREGEIPARAHKKDQRWGNVASPSSSPLASVYISPSVSSLVVRGRRMRGLVAERREFIYGEGEEREREKEETGILRMLSC